MEKRVGLRLSDAEDLGGTDGGTEKCDKDGAYNTCRMPHHTFALTLVPRYTLDQPIT
jgi:hypothetical protein